MRERNRAKGTVHHFAACSLKLLAWLPVVLQAQHYSFKSYGRQDGLSSPSVRCLLQDRTGYIWVGTNNGLFRYDGTGFVRFGAAEGLRSSRITALHQTMDGALWVTTSGGLAVLSNERFQPVELGSKITSSPGPSLDSDSKGRLYVGVENGIMVAEPANPPARRKFQRLSGQGLPDTVVHLIYADSHGHLWFGSQDRLYHFDGDRAVRLGTKEGLPADYWSGMRFDAEGNLWVRSATRLMVRPRNERSFVARNHGLPAFDGPGASLLEYAGRLVVPTVLGLAMQDGHTWRLVGESQGLPAASVSCILRDKEGSLWVGFGGAGLARWVGSGEWESWTGAEGFRSDHIRSVYMDSSRRLWAGTSTGLYELRPGERIWRQHPALAGTGVLSITGDTYGILWMGSPGALIRLDSHTGATRKYGPESGLKLRDEDVTGISLDASRRLWISTNGNLYRSSDPKSSLTFEIASPPWGRDRQSYSRCLPGRNGDIWVGSGLGLARWRQGSWTRFTTENGLVNNKIGYLTESPDGAIWVAYREALGITRVTFDRDVFRTQQFTQNSGLNSEKIRFLGVDVRGWVWSGTDDGVDLFNGASWRHFGRPEGLIWDYCNSNAFYAGADGTVAIGTSRGLSLYRPAANGAANKPPQVILRSAKLGGLAVKAGASPTVPYRQGTLAVSFSALTFLDDTVRFRYRLVGFEKECVTTTQRETRYANLPPGRFEFQVQASSGGAWSEQAGFSFRIRPAWWQSWLFRGAFLIAFCFAIRATWRWRIRCLMRDRRQMEMLQSEAKFRLLFSNNPQPMCLLEAGTLDFLEVNDAAIQTFGYSLEEFLRMSLSHVVLPGDEPHLIEAALIISDPPRAAQVRLRRKDGAIRHVEITQHSLELGGRRAVLALLQDLTDRRSLEEQVRRSQKLEAVGQLAGGIAHDFNNLLTVITGYSQLLLSRIAAGGPMRSELDQIEKAGKRAAALTKQLLAFSRRQVLQPKVINLNHVIAGMAQTLKRLLGDEIDLVTTLDPGLWGLHADPGQVEQILMNLALNARDAMPDGGKVTIQTSNGDFNGSVGSECVILAVTDTGHGMNAETRARVFEPFFTTKGVGKGTGLGLSTVYGIVKQSDGDIHVSTEPGKGTTFLIYLPRAGCSVPQEPDTRTPAPAAVPDSWTVLLVDDEPGVRMLARRILEEHGYSVLLAESGQQAIQISERHNGAIDLLLSDITMPQMNGHKLAERISRSRPNTSVLFMSGYSEPAIFRNDLGPDAMFVQKPFTAETLLSAVQDALHGEQRVPRM